MREEGADDVEEAVGDNLPGPLLGDDNQVERGTGGVAKQGGQQCLKLV